MNITEQIAEIILKGQTVELPGIGTLASRQVEAHFDAASNTFFPTRQEIVFNPGMRGGCDMVAVIADKECVSNATAVQFWRNYADALADKLDKSGKMEIPGVGTLAKADGTYTFEGVAVAGTNPAMAPISDLKTYVHTDNPFAAYNAAPEPVVAPTPAPEPVVEPEPEPEPEVAPVVEEAVPEPLPTAALVAEAEAEAEETKAEEDSSVEEVPAQEPAPEPVTEPAADAVEEEPAPAQEEKKEEEIDPLQSLADMQQQPTPERYEKKEKKKGGWVWIILILLLLLAGGAAAWYFLLRDKEENSAAIDSDRLEEMVSGSEGTNADAEETDLYGDSIEDDATAEGEENAIMDEEAGEEEAEAEADMAEGSAEETEAPVENRYLPFTLCDDLFEYESDEIEALAQVVGKYMAGYVADYAKAERYGKAAEKLQERVAQYAGERLAELLAPNYSSASQFLPSKDYIRDFISPSLRDRKASHKRHEVQKELMDRSVLSQLLNEVVEANGIEQDALTAAPAAPKDKPVKTNANYRTTSKAGFDVIAGFFTVKGNADKLATQLKRQGCDAYVIEINHGYYVSMGSKSSRTEVERLYQHLKEWYSGDMAIKQF